ncbi:MAG: hypothetical protein MPK62_06250 [Alphaproteobacteria bacterium]|nr:hypothetical protein [Alphaproteobacteria bacterium]
MGGFCGLEGGCKETARVASVFSLSCPCFCSAGRIDGAAFFDGRADAEIQL